MLLAMSCASPEQQASSSTGLRKVTIASQDEVERLRSLGFEILVQEQNYVIVYQDSARIGQLEAAAITTTAAQETDLVQRLVKARFADREQLQRIVDLGIDVWEVEGDSVLARAYDLQLSKMKADSVGYRIVEQYAGRKEGAK